MCARAQAAALLRPFSHITSFSYWQVLARVSTSKATWYLERGLAKEVERPEDDVRRIQLNFAAKGLRMALYLQRASVAMADACPPMSHHRARARWRHLPLGRQGQ